MSSSPNDPGNAPASDLEIVVAHQARATLRVGDVFLKIDSEQGNIDAEVEAIELAPVPTPTILWQKPNVLALARVPGTALGRLGEPSPAPASAWAAVGAVVRRLHEAPMPARQGASLVDVAARLDGECEALTRTDLLSPEVLARGGEIARGALRSSRPVFMHGDLQLDHVFVDGDQVTGIIDWSAAGRGDALFDLATLTIGHEEHLDDVLAGYGGGVDRDRVRAWWAVRSLLGIRWLAEHGFDPAAPGAEIDVLKSLA
ncbi:phosphotransferase [Gryllotalpicola daejeonensis]|uniref:Phosphotransferase n=1 Tax=Gryllotalpicola daejeonensis TaxID=993087 RepID=A0ABP7ZKD1_9MICO